MYHYLFTNDLRVSNLDESLKRAAICFITDTVPTSAENKSANNNMNTLGFYFTLNKNSNCAKVAASGNTRAVVLNFIKKFQFPNMRTAGAFNESKQDNIKLAPMRVIVKILYMMNLLHGNLIAYLTKEEIKYFIFYNEDVAKKKSPDIGKLISDILEYRKTGVFPSNISTDENEHEWKHEERQIREMLKVLLWSGCITEKDDKYIIDNDELSNQNKADIFDIITCDMFWEGSTIESYREYMDMPELLEDKEKNEGEAHMEVIFNTNVDTEFEDRNRIIFGAPGTGKSYGLKKDCEKLLSDTTGTYERVTFHPDYSYSQFVGTYKPVMDADGNSIRYDFVPGPFMRVYVEAMKSGRTEVPQPHLLIIEEINRAKVAAVFGDVFQLLDRDDNGVSEYEIQASEDIRRYLSKELGGASENYQRIRIPNNMFIWATMNSADQGVFPMDTAFKRRWSFEYLGINENEEQINGKGKILLAGSDEPIEWNMLRKAINNKMSSSDFKINEDKLMGPFFLSKKVMESDEYGMIKNPEKFIKAFKSKVIMYLYEDAVKQGKHRFFDGCSDTSKYSSICDAFDEIGISIFGLTFREDFYNTEKDD